MILQGCNLTGTLPSGPFLPDSMEELELRKNQLSGTIPTEFTQLKNMQVMSLQDNELGGPIPPSFAFKAGAAFVGLSIEGNNFSGEAAVHAALYNS